MESEILNKIFGHPAASKKRGQIFGKHFFRLWVQLSPTRSPSIEGVFSQMLQENIIALNFVEYVFQTKRYGLETDTE